jgi:hypothetical protein
MDGEGLLHLGFLSVSCASLSQLWAIAISKILLLEKSFLLVRHYFGLRCGRVS